MNTSGVVFLDKPLGWSSRRAVNEISKLYSQPNTKRIKAGHAGTLDPLATGMLPILIGEATRFADFGLSADKQYRFTMDLSYQTDTLDCEGKMTEQFKVTQLQQCEVEAVVQQFVGSISQIPPLYSAIHVDGKRAHELARSGQQPVLEAREVVVHAIHIDQMHLPEMTMTVSCSKGTYVRSLARDIGKALNLGGCVTQLRRLSSGGWPASCMVEFDDLKTDPDQYLITVQQWLRDYATVQLHEAEARRFIQGQRIPLKGTTFEENQNVQVICDDRFLGLACCKQGLKSLVLQPEKVLPSAQQFFSHRGTQ